MHKKIMLACMAIAAFAAFVIAPVASASPVLTENGTALAVGASVTGKNTGITKFTASGFNVECNNDDLVGTVKKNTGTEIEGTIPVGGASFKGTGASGDCTSLLGSTSVAVNSEICMTSIPKTDQFTIDGCLVNTNGTNVTEPVTFTLTITPGTVCKFKAATITGTYTTNSTPATVNIVEQGAELEEGGFPCPSSGKLDMDFDLYTTDGVTGVTIS